MGDIIKRKDVTTRRLPCRLTDEERTEKLEDLAASIGTVDDLRRQVDAKAEELKYRKKRLAEEEGRRDSVAAIVNTGFEDRSVACDEILDFDQSRVILIRTDTEEMVQAPRAMNSDERQTEIYHKDAEPIDPEALRAMVAEFFERSGEDLFEGDEDNAGEDAEDDDGPEE